MTSKCASCTHVVDTSLLTSQKAKESNFLNWVLIGEF